MCNTINLEAQLRRFWELEDITPPHKLSEEEQKCEEIFANTYQRDNQGRFIVHLPFSKDSNDLGNSKDAAVTRFLQLERRFKRDPALFIEYQKCIHEYLALNHAVKSTSSDSVGYYLPHHAVIKSSSTSTKLRVVFDASQKSKSGLSLNDILLTGPTIQDDLILILLRWRTYKIAFSADIEKMYRQVNVTENHKKFQRILWRDQLTDDISEYQLTTVTFGVTSAPFLAIKALQQLAIDEKEKFPIASKITLSDFYVDNVLSGADDVEEALTAQKQLIELHQAGGFPLRKWAANHNSILESIPPDYLEKATTISLDRHEEIKTLGIYWSPSSDTFHFNITLPENPPEPTKRSILSEVSKLFDPLGWIAPVVIVGKIFIQKLWLQKLDWDESIAQNSKKEWLAYRASLIDLRKISVPRWIGTSSENIHYQLHGFCDASMNAYAANVYLVTNFEGTISTQLIACKTKVSPVKTVSLPRLELCGAVLLAKLVEKILPSLPQPKIEGKYMWSDSQITLAWLRGQPRSWKTFVENRVSQVHQKLKDVIWYHIPTELNPADCGTRGLSPTQLQQHSLWWHGPSFLTKDKQHWPPQSHEESTTLEKKKIMVHTAQVIKCDLIDRYSSFTKLLRVAAYVLRFIDRIRKRINASKQWLSSSELQRTKLQLIRCVQLEDFADEIKAIKSNKELSSHSKIQNLLPFIDGEGILRVGGRISNSNLPFSRQHPIILSGNHHFSKLLTNYFHLSSLHGNISLVLSLLRAEYWILNGRNLVKSCIHKCVVCYRQRAETQQQLMGNLPAPRITPSRPFTHTGIDYCGPFQIKFSKGRGVRAYKGYVSLFICLCTKAIHLEVVSDYTTAAFLAAFKRFTSRRGLCCDVYTDQGTNFVGAKATLDREYQAIISTIFEEAKQNLANDRINWHLIPPASPHFGGLWEAGIKSTKYHMKRILGNSTFTYEELTTIITQIEANLNSRPLCALYDTVDNLEVLTPGHFLIGDAIRVPPEPSVLDMKTLVLDRWKQLQQVSQHFWRKWSDEYLARLQQRPKWNRMHPNLVIGDLVLIKDERLPPGKWLMGKILEVHRGTDDLVRVVTLKTKDNIMQRPVAKLCKLPIEKPEELRSNLNLIQCTPKIS